MFNKILIIDDEDLFREDLADLLTMRGYICRTASNSEIALKVLKDFSPDIIISDIVMPGKSGIDNLDEINLLVPEAAVIIMTSYGSLETSLEAFRKGVVDYILKPVLIEDLIGKIERIKNYKKLVYEVKILRKEVNKDLGSFKYVANSASMLKIIDEVQKVAQSRSTVLISGESGTGKEIIAKLIHEYSDSKDEPFIAINCSGFQENLLESELFGYTKGAFTGAIADKPGFFEISGSGTIFLDEISEMAIGLQSKLLRALEQREFYRVGDTKLIKIKSRIITATNKNLKKQVEKGKFREDLFFRIAVFELKLPSLRERVDDIPYLVDYFIKYFNKEMKKNVQGLSPDVLKSFLIYQWPGNIRELRNIIERAMILCNNKIISMDELPEEFGSNNVEKNNIYNLKSSIQSFEKHFILRVLKKTNWNKEETAKLLEINSSTLYRKMSELNITLEKE